jgi:polyisoprenoid-binding protein YceI
MKLRPSLLPALGAAALLWAAGPAAAQVKLVPAQSEIAFVSKQLGVPVEGHFKKFDAQVAFDPRQPAAGKVAFSIDVGSATLGVPEADAELPTPTWFNAAKFPQASFQSTAIKALGGGRFEVAGKLAIKGSSRDIVVPVLLTQSGATSTASGSFSMQRLAFKIGEGEWADTSMVANDVQVRFKLALSGMAPL